MGQLEVPTDQTEHNIITNQSNNHQEFPWTETQQTKCVKIREFIMIQNKQNPKRLRLTQWGEILFYRNSPALFKNSNNNNQREGGEREER